MSETNVFNVRKFEKPNLFQKLLGRKPGKNALIALNNLLASRGIEEIGQDDIVELEADFKLNFKIKYPREIRELYKIFLKHCISDKNLSNKEKNNLNRLKEILQIDESDAIGIYNEVVGELYQLEVQKAIEDGRLSLEEKDFLLRVKQNLAIPEDLATNIYENSAQQLLEKYMDNALADQRLTENEEEEFQAIKKSLRVEVAMDTPTRIMLEKCRLFAQIEGGELPEFEVAIDLKSELCHFYGNLEWIVQKSKKKPKANLSQHLKTSSDWNKIDEKDQPAIEDIWAETGKGKIYLTNQRIILDKNEIRIDIELNQIMDLNGYRQGVEILLSDSKSFFLQLEDHIDIFIFILGNIIIQKHRCSNCQSG
jgi:hypothetical protein